jgi:hypothetical protein
MDRLTSILTLGVTTLQTLWGKRDVFELQRG